MKVILQTEIIALGSEGDLVNVARGYANNYLVPRGLAIPATPGNLKQLETKRKAIEKRAAAAKAEAEAIAAKLSDQTVSLKVKTGTEGKLYGSVTAKDICEAIEERLGVKLDRKQIQLGEAIKDVGSYSVPVALHKEVTPKVTVEIQAAEA